MGLSLSAAVMLGLHTVNMGREHEWCEPSFSLTPVWVPGVSNRPCPFPDWMS